MIHTQTPTNNNSLREKIHQGCIYKLTPSNESQVLAESVTQLLIECFNTNELDKLHDKLNDADFFAAMKKFGDNYLLMIITLIYCEMLF